MSCCGNRREALRHDQSRAAGAAARWVSGPAEFVFHGRGHLTVTGPMTGLVYRFSGGGPPVRVHASDVPSLVSVPGLQLAR